MPRAEEPFWDVVEALRTRAPRYRREAYGFVIAALGIAVQALPPQRRADPDLRHLTGEELLRGVIALARREFGGLADVVFREWGVTRGEDVGRIVFQLVEGGQLSARPTDTIEDFLSGPDLLRELARGRERESGRSDPARHDRSGDGTPAAG